jgi:hypothetical protein
MRISVLLMKSSTQTFLPPGWSPEKASIFCPFANTNSLSVYGIFCYLLPRGDSKEVISRRAGDVVWEMALFCLGPSSLHQHNKMCTFLATKYNAISSRMCDYYHYIVHYLKSALLCCVREERWMRFRGRSDNNDRRLLIYYAFEVGDVEKWFARS